MKRRTFISMMSVMAAAGVLTLSGCSNSSTSTAASSGASSVAGSAADQLAAIQASGKLIVALEGAWQPWSYHDESWHWWAMMREVSRAIAEKLGAEPGKHGRAIGTACSPVWTLDALTWSATAWRSPTSAP